MLCNIPDQREQFKEFMFTTLNEVIFSQTKNIRNWIHGKIIKPEYLNKIIEVLETYKIPYKIRNTTEHIFFGDISILSPKIKMDFDLFHTDDGHNCYIQEGQVGICYLEQYKKNDKEREAVFRKILDDFFWENRDVIIERHSTSVVHYNEYLFEDELKFNRYCYFVADEKHKEDFKNLANYVLGYDVEINYLNVVNQEFDINGLIWLKFKDQYRQTESSLSYRLLCLLMDCNINHCIFHDMDGNLELDLRIKPKNDDNRISVTKFRIDLEKIFRSTWEANFARILNYLNIKWDYEKEGFELEDRYYIPDFFLPNNTIVEIKGFWDLDSRTKVQSFMERYNEYKLYLIDADMLISLEKLYKDKIKEWEEQTVTIQKEVIPVVGITLPQRKKFVSALQTGDEVFLERDSKNSYDKNAIQVLNREGKQIGFISKDWATIYAPKLDIGMKFKVIIKSKQEKVIKVEIVRDNISENVLYNFLINPAVMNS